MSENSCLDAAIQYLSRGWSSIPLCPPDHQDCEPAHIKTCGNPGKVPLWPWKQYQTQRPSEKVLRILFKRNPRCNVGIALGPVSGLLAIDADGPEADLLLSDLFGEQGLPQTLHLTTPGGGRRLFYSCGQDCTVTKRRFQKDSSHVIVMGTGSQSVMPPSLHANGTLYQWPQGDIPPLAAAPPILLDIDRHKQPEPTHSDRRIERAAAYLDKCQPAISGQGGHNQTFKVACKIIKGFALNEKEAIELLLTHYNSKCQPPWTEAEITHKVQDALKQPGQNGVLLEANVATLTSTNTHVLPRKTPKPSVNIITADSLLAANIPEITWAIEGLVPEGATILAGRPKAGKSWLVLQLALAVTTTGKALNAVTVAHGSVLFLALEDGQRRLQRRLLKLLGAHPQAAPSDLHLSVQWPRSNQGGINTIEEWIAATDGARLVVIDTLARIRDRSTGRSGIYEEDYEAIACLQNMAMRRHVAVLVVTHTRKPRNTGQVEDPLDEVQNSTGLTGAADVVLVLKHPRYAKEGKLFVTGRDVEERELSLTWNTSTCLWSQDAELDPDDPESHLSSDQRKVREILKAAGQPMGVLELNMQLKKEYSAAAQLLHRMAKEGLLKKVGYGQYALPDADSQTQSSCQTDPMP